MSTKTRFEKEAKGNSEMACLLRKVTGGIRDLQMGLRDTDENK